MIEMIGEVLGVLAMVVLGILGIIALLFVLMCFLLIFSGFMCEGLGFKAFTQVVKHSQTVHYSS